MDHFGSPKSFSLIFKVCSGHRDQNVWVIQRDSEKESLNFTLLNKGHESCWDFTLFILKSPHIKVSKLTAVCMQRGGGWQMGGVGGGECEQTPLAGQII